MMQLVPFVVGMGAADVVLCAVFAALYRRERREHLRAWAFAHALDLLRQAFNVAALVLGGSAPLSMAAGVAQTFGALFLVKGTLAFVGRRAHPAWIVGAFATSGWVAASRLLEAPFWAANLPTSLLLGLARIAAGASLLRAKGEPSARALAGGSLLLWGVHSLNFPFLRTADWFAPWGFTIAMILATSVGIGMLVLHLDRARAEERESARRYQELFDGAIEGVFRSSVEGRILAANPALVRMLGYEREAELDALDLARDVYADPDDRARFLALEDGGTMTVKVKRRDGALRELSLHRRAARDGAGNVRYFEGSVHDVTEERRLRDELEKVQRLEALGRLAGGIAHDFNNVLGAIVAAVDLARLRVKRGHCPESELADIRDAAMRAADLTRQLLALARRTSLNRQPTELRRAIEGTARVLGRVIGERVSLEVELGDDPLFALVDAGQVDQVVMNLALNARDAMPDGGRLRISTSRVVTGGVEEARLSVEDTGVGMDDATREHMFDPFFSTKPHGAGYGLGLAMVYGAVGQNGGRIEVASAVGRGTRVDVFFPLVDAAAVEPPAALAREPGGDPRAKILLVEDEPALRRSVGAALRDAGHEVRTAENADEALDRVREWSPDLLVTDIVMPGLSGPDLARAVRARHPRCAVIVVTGYAPEPLDESLAEGCELLEKPFTIDALLEAVARQRGLVAGADAPPRTPVAG